ncbi:MAG: hypothetical protein NTY00_02960 [Deltaproteobacteria bacterium]|nr:hypothetical protein [Deltaproteobacteria bacterium]
MKKKLLLLLGICLVITCSSSAFAAVTLKRLGTHPFYRPAMTSETDLRTMVKKHSADIKTGFAKSGYPELFPDFMAQFPTAKVEFIKVAPGERVDWMLFRKKGTGPVAVIKDVTWGGKAAFDAYSFTIDKDGQRYEFIVPAVCGNLSLRNISRVPEPVVPVVPVTPVVIDNKDVQKATVVQDQRKGGPVADIGYAYQFDPTSYVFARVGYEFPLTERLYAMGLVGGFARVGGDDADSAFTADALLNYYLTEKWFVGAGAGYWSGNDGKADLIVNMGYLIYEKPGTMKTSLFVEGRCEADDLISSQASRLGVGLRFQF